MSKKTTTKPKKKPVKARSHLGNHLFIISAIVDGDLMLYPTIATEVGSAMLWVEKLISHLHPDLETPPEFKQSTQVDDGVAEINVSKLNGWFE